MSAPMNNCKRKILEAFFIAVKRPTLNEQKDSKMLTLFRNGVTCLAIFTIGNFTDFIGVNATCMSFPL